MVFLCFLCFVCVCLCLFFIFGFICLVFLNNGRHFKVPSDSFNGFATAPVKSYFVLKCKLAALFQTFSTPCPHTQPAITTADASRSSWSCI